MGKLISYLGSSKILKKIADFLNVTDVKVNGFSVVDTNGVANIDLSLYTGIKVVEALPETGLSNFIYLVPKDDPGIENVYDEYVWTEDGWELIGSTEIDLSDYYTKTESDNRYVQPGDLAAVATSGSYNDLSNKPTIPAAQVNSDWTATSGVAKILNKPTLATVATSGSYNDLSNKPTIPDELADLSDDSTHRLVTDTEKSTWNATAVYKQLSNEDLDTVKTTGFYVGKSGNTCTNKPSNVTGQFGLIVVRTATSQNNYYEQICIAPTGELYFRRQYGASQGWNSWVGLTIPANDGTIALQETFSPKEPEPASQDLNDYKESGVYYFTSTNAPLNVPVGSNGMLLVFKAVWNSSQDYIFVKQIWLRHGTQNSNDYHTYIRTYRTDSNTWSNWHRVITSEGGSISGNLTIVVPNTATTTTNSGINLGNATPEGTEGTTRGVINIYGIGANYVQFVDGRNVAITGNRTLYLPDKTGVLAVSEDLNLTQLNDRSLFYTPYYRNTPYTYREVTYTYTSDGTLTANGTATGGNSNFHYRVYASNQYIKGGKAYYFKACPSGGSDSKYWSELSFGDDNNTTLLTVKDYGSGVKVIAPSDAIKVSCQFVIKSGYTVSDLSFKPMLTPYDGWVELGSISASATNFTKNNYKELKAIFELDYSSYKKYVTVFFDYANISTSERYFTSGFFDGEVSVIASFIMGTNYFSIKTGAILPTGMSIPSAILYAKA